MSGAIAKICAAIEADDAAVHLYAEDMREVIAALDAAEVDAGQHRARADAAEAALADCAEIAGVPYLGAQGLAGAVRLRVARADERADAAEAECARLREYIDVAACEAERVLARMEAAARTFVRVREDRDAARAEADALRAQVAEAKAMAILAAVTVVNGYIDRECGCPQARSTRRCPPRSTRSQRRRGMPTTKTAI